MQPIAHIRKNVLKLSQADFAKVAGVTQATVSRWEAGEFDPGLSEMSLIRAAARSKHSNWDDAWFFAVPAVAAVSTRAPA